MKTELDNLIAKAFESEGATADVNKVYLALLRTELHFPAILHEAEEEPFTPLFANEGELIFMVVFDSKERLSAWAKLADAEDIDTVSLRGSDLISGLGENVFLALNPGSEGYKEFSPEEVARLKTMVAKVSALTKKTA